MSDKVRCYTEIQGAPKAVGPYSPATVANGFAFLSGQVGLNPENGQLVAGGIEEQTVQALANLKAVLAGIGSSTADVVKTTIFLSDMGFFATVNKIYEREMSGHKPARSTFQVAGLPLGALVEIEMIAAVK